MQLLTPLHWQDYELIDSGNFEKLERFGDYILARPEPQAIWDKSLSDADWKKKAHATFVRDKQATERGEWQLTKGMPEKWWINYRHAGLSLRLKCSLTSFKHVGIFPEQAVNWDYLDQKLRALPVEKPAVLNLFAYTGAASVAARQAGADVTHVDSIKPVVTWARENMEASDADNIRWMVEDAFKFVQREVRRGKKYNCIILDPPAYGRGPAGEKWILEEQLNELLKSCAELLDPVHHVFILNLYSLGFSALMAENLVLDRFGKMTNAQCGELYLADHKQRKLPLGIFYRFASV
ncbi:class I SAM-dependent methyltransferase [Runella salmonicolor]|uniref:Class I SAM-dependent methyltransferase n=1 Tax=Runella salmonicolor TaxID=2950278 RepID=A0ABT1FNN3_9BACT|nr:class I SAM-dependent methyltransferase [Runella salmonicolor]MCP1382127.1 class I SAM-dependent methyltransferase [Runella salmonicolor]